jgi:hypothetical protein
MTDRKRSKSEERSYAALMGEICDLEHLHRTMQLKKRVLPPGLCPNGWCRRPRAEPRRSAARGRW